MFTVKTKIEISALFLKVRFDDNNDAAIDLQYRYQTPFYRKQGLDLDLHNALQQTTDITTVAFI